VLLHITRRLRIDSSKFSQFPENHWLVHALLQRAKRASGAPWVRKSGNLLMREILVVTSANVRPYRLRGRGRKDGILLPQSGCRGTTLPSPRVCTDGRAGVR